MSDRQGDEFPDHDEYRLRVQEAAGERYWLDPIVRRLADHLCESYELLLETERELEKRDIKTPRERRAEEAERLRARFHSMRGGHG